MKPRGSIRTNLKKWKTRLGRAKKIPKLATKNTAITPRRWKAPAPNMALRQQLATSSVLIADRMIVVVDAVAAEGVPCGESLGTNQRGRCLQSVICSRKARKFWSRSPK